MQNKVKHFEYSTDVSNCRFVFDLSRKIPHPKDVVDLSKTFAIYIFEGIMRDEKTTLFFKQMLSASVEFSLVLNYRFFGQSSLISAKST